MGHECSRQQRWKVLWAVGMWQCPGATIRNRALQTQGLKTMDTHSLTHSAAQNQGGGRAVLSPMRRFVFPGGDGIIQSPPPCRMAFPVSLSVQTSLYLQGHRCLD